MQHKSQTRKARALFGLILLTGLFCAAQSAAVFTQGPAIEKQGDSAVVINFTVSEGTDVEVGIADANGKIINHLAAGVLGGVYQPPEPLKQGLTQTLVWNFRDDDGGLTTGSGYKVRVRLGVKPKFVWKKVTGPSWIGGSEMGYYYGDRREWQPLQLGGAGSYGKVGNITQIPAKYNNGAYVSTMMQMYWTVAPADSAIMVLLKREADFFVCARDDRPKEPFLSRYTETEDSILACGKSYSIYKAHGQAGDRFYLPDGFEGSDWGIPKCFCFIESDAYVEEALDPWNTNPQTDFLCKWHPTMMGTQMPWERWVGSGDQTEDLFYINMGTNGEQCYNAATGKFLYNLADAEKSGWGSGTIFFGGVNGNGSTSGKFAVDFKNQVFYVFGAASGAPEGNGALYRFNMSDGKPAPWPQTGKYWVGGLVPKDFGWCEWAGGEKGVCVGPDGEIYINSGMSPGAGAGEGLQVKVVKDGAIIDSSRIRVNAWFSTIKVDRRGNIYVGCNVKPKDYPVLPEEVQGLLNPPPSYVDVNAMSKFTACILKFPNTGGTLLSTENTDYDYVFLPGAWNENRLKPTGLTWCYFGFSKLCGWDVSCWCSTGSFDLDNWGRLFVPNAVQAEMAALDNNRNIIYKTKSRDIPEAGGIVPGNIAVTDNYVIASDWMQGAYYGFKLDAQSSWFVDIATGVAYNNIENGLNANVASISIWPNPFVSSIGFKYVITANANGPVNLGVYDLQGRLIRELVNNSQASGVYNVNWDGRDAKGASVSNGVYVYRFKTNGCTVVGRIAVLR